MSQRFTPDNFCDEATNVEPEALKCLEPMREHLESTS